MARQDRLQVTISPEMGVALGILAERTGLQVSTQAMVLLRQALDRTIGSAECRERMRKRSAGQSAAQWRADRYADRYVEVRRQAAGMAEDVADARTANSGGRPQ